MGSANIEGGPLTHLMIGKLSFQIELYLFLDLPSYRNADSSPKVWEICQRYGLACSSAPLKRQFGTTMKRVFRLALPNELPTWVPQFA